jgi:simple sugar transport system permease protein
MEAAGEVAQRGLIVMGWPFICLALSKATPLLLGALGGILCELSGVINFALEGMMLAGAFGAMWATFVFQSPWMGILGGIGGGMVIAGLHAIACLNLRANQIVSSIALNLLAAGTTGMLLNQVFKVYGTSPTVKRLPELGQFLSATFPDFGVWMVPFLGSLSILGPAALILGLAMLGFFKWATWGLHIRACGENPLAAEAAGISVGRTRFFAVLMSGSLAGLGGAYLAVGELSQFVEHITQGRGYLAIAALILGRWKPLGVLWATLLFGLSDAASESLAVQWSGMPNQFFLALPYLVCFAALMLRLGKNHPPSALGKL